VISTRRRTLTWRGRCIGRHAEVLSQYTSSTCENGAMPESPNTPARHVRTEPCRHGSAQKCVHAALQEIIGTWGNNSNGQ
jgi:hypothetical protein